MNSACSEILLSIIIPSFNSEKYISSVMDSIARQAFKNYEIIFMDNLSTDGTLKVLNQYVQVNRITIISEPDTGIYDAMNKGIKRASGQWLYFMGSDDSFYGQDVLKNISTMFDETNDILYGDVRWMPENKMEAGEVVCADLINRNINHQRIFYRKYLFEKWGGFNLDYKVASDHELNIRYFCNPQITKKYVPVVIADYNSGGFSSNKTDEAFWKDWKTIFRKNFSPDISEKEMYNKLGWYCRYQIDKHHYGSAFKLFVDVCVHNFSPGFVKLTLNHLFKSFGKNTN